MQMLSAEKSQLVFVDVQTKLSGAMDTKAMAAMVKNCGILAQAAAQLDITTMITEQYPKGLGETLPEITQYVARANPIAKTVFSACHAPKFKSCLQRNKSQIILAGLETHICILQTALDLLAQDKQVFVVEDAVISRSENNKQNALSRLAQAGCIITNTESVLFECLGSAEHAAFKALSKLIR